MSGAILRTFGLGSTTTCVLCMATAQPSSGQLADRPTECEDAVVLTNDDWIGIRAAHQAARYAAYPAASGYLTYSASQQWRISFDGVGFLAEPETGGWTWGLALERYGTLRDEVAVTSPAAVVVNGDRITYSWGAELEEWYVNDARGLEHGYTVHRRPTGRTERETSPLAFTLEVRGELIAEVMADGRGIRFRTKQRAVVLTYTGLSVFDAGGRELEARFECIGDRVRLSVNDRDADYPLTIDPVAQQAYLQASNSEVGDYFGESVAISGDTVVVGAGTESSGATGVNGNEGDDSFYAAGAAYVFVRSGGGWRQEAYLKASNTNPLDYFGCSVAISGDTVVVGASGEASNATGVDGDESNNNAPRAGAAYVFIRTGTSWSQQAYLKASNTNAEDFFGLSVAVSGDTVVVGASGEASSATVVNGNAGDNSAADAGAAYVFVRSGSSWNQEAYLKASNTQSDDQFGRRVGISDDTIVVTAYEEDSAATGVNGDESDNSAFAAGAAYVFVRMGTSWSQQAYLKASNTGWNDRFGRSAAVQGDVIVIGASEEDSDASGVNGDDNNVRKDSGAAYVFVRSGTNWMHEAYLKASNPNREDLFGWSVAVTSDTVLVGARRERSGASGINGDQTDNSLYNAGAAYLFERSGGSWGQRAYLKASMPDEYDAFGFDVAISDDDALVVGAVGDEAAYVFDLGGPALGARYCTPAAPNSTGDWGRIRALGSTEVIDDDLTLSAGYLPLANVGYFLASDGDSAVQPPGAAGLFCLAGGTHVRRLLPPILNTDQQNGGFELSIGTRAVPGLGAITPGRTWNFQAWYRDNAAGTSNFTDAVSVTFD